LGRLGLEGEATAYSDTPGIDGDAIRAETDSRKEREFRASDARGEESCATFAGTTMSIPPKFTKHHSHIAIP
jgi:hypothetical protein